jgi:tetratricopeptide (TPR) repeat protein
VDPQAYDDYLQGRALVARRVGDSTRLAVEAFDRAIAKDPSYSAAHSGRAFALTIGSYWADWLPREQLFAMASTSVDEALRLDPNNAEAYMTRGIMESTNLKIAAGKADFDRALELAPGSVDVINFYGDFLQFTGDLRGSEAMKRKAIALDPLAFIHPINLGQTLLAQGRAADALQMTQRGVAIGTAAGATSLWGNLLQMQLRSGLASEAQRTWDANCIAPIATDVARCRAMRIPLLGSAGRTADMERELASLTRDVHAGKAVVQYGGIKGYVGLAGIYLLAANDPHRAAAQIRASLGSMQWYGYDKLLLTQTGLKLPEEISKDPDWLAVWNDPRLAEYMAAYRANLAQFRAGN